MSPAIPRKYLEPVSAAVESERLSKRQAGYEMKVTRNTDEMEALVVERKAPEVDGAERAAEREAGADEEWTSGV